MPLTLTTLIPGTEPVVTEHANMVAVHKHLERFAARHGWFWSKRPLSSRTWAGRFTTPTGTEAQATFLITKVAPAPALSPRQASMLAWLIREGRPVNVANRQTVAALVRRGLIEYVPNPVYGTPVRVTEAGRTAVAPAPAPRFGQLPIEADARVTNEHGHLGTVLAVRPEEGLAQVRFDPDQPTCTVAGQDWWRRISTLTVV